VIGRPAWSRSALAAAAVALVWLVGAPADAGTTDAGDLLLDARRVSAVESFAGIVEVSWHDDANVAQVAQVVARSVEGAFVVGMATRNTVGDDDERYTRTDHEHSTRWEPVGGRPAPAPDATWDLAVAGRHEVAARPATIVVARDQGGKVRARFSIDRETGQLLRRAVLDEHGDAVHVVAFVTIVSGEAEKPSLPVPPIPGADNVKAPEALDHTPKGFVSHDEVGPGYELLGRYRQPDGAVHLYYSDGLFTLSVFESPGKVDWDALAPGSNVPVEGLRARSYSSAAGTIVVWGQDGLVLTAVGDGPSDMVFAVVAELSSTSDESWVDDVTNFVLGPFDWE
jgi:hypothetical protein